MSEYYIYIAKLDGIPRYVGFGSKNRYEHVNSGVSHLRILNETVLKHEKRFEIEFILTHLTKSEACKKEQETILEFGREDLNTGTLWNTTNGGIGFHGWHTSASRAKISEHSKRMWSDPVKKKQMSDKLKSISSSTRFVKGQVAANANDYDLISPDGTVKHIGKWKSFSKTLTAEDFKTLHYLKQHGKPSTRGKWKGWKIQKHV